MDTKLGRKNSDQEEKWETLKKMIRKAQWSNDTTRNSIEIQIFAVVNFGNSKIDVAYINIHARHQITNI